MSLKFGGSPDSTDLAIPAANKASLRLQLTATRIENLCPRHRNAALEQSNKQLRNRLRQYENPNTPPSKEGGAGVPPDSESSSTDHDDEDTSETDETSTDDDTERTDDETVGGDSDAASDSSPGRSSGHEETTQPPPDPDKTVWVEKGYCPDCDRILTDPDNYISQTVIETPLPVPLTVVKYELGKHCCVE